ncbi:MAG TPA: SRPBCC family protein [Thermoplasmata archaeon]|nr:SRPBCC family protein [Thermoplasmata archaeon]
MSGVPHRPPPNAAALHADRSVGGRAVLELRRFLRHPPERVWTAITDPAELRHWYLSEVHIEGRVGGRVESTTGSFRVRATGRVLAWEPPRLFEHEWNVDPSAGFPKGEVSVVRWELAPFEDGTLLTLTHRDLTPSTARGFRAGAEAFLDRLVAQLDGVPLPEWETRIRELRDAGSAAE